MLYLCCDSQSHYILFGLSVCFSGTCLGNFFICGAILHLTDFKDESVWTTVWCYYRDQSRELCLWFCKMCCYRMTYLRVRLRQCIQLGMLATSVTRFRESLHSNRNYKCVNVINKMSTPCMCSRRSHKMHVPQLQTQGSQSAERSTVFSDKREGNEEGITHSWFQKNVTLKNIVVNFPRYNGSSFHKLSCQRPSTTVLWQKAFSLWQTLFSIITQRMCSSYK